MAKKSTDPFKIWSSFQLWHFFKVAQSYSHGPKLAQMTVLTKLLLVTYEYTQKYKIKEQ